MKRADPDDTSGANGDTPEASRLPALEWMQRAHAGDEVLLEVRRQLRARRRHRLAVASAACLFFVLAGVLWHVTRPAVVPERGQLAASATVLWPASQTLSDGSIIELRGDAQVDVDYRPEVRRVRLRRGEAHFQVAKNPHRPFVVVADNVEVRAVGTAFAVELGSRNVEVLVTEGRVAVAEKPVAAAIAAPAAAVREPAAALVDAGNRCVVPGAASAVAAAPQVEAVSAAELSTRLAWRVPQLEFSRAPLTEVVRLMNTHGTAPHGPTFVIGDPLLADVKLSGYLRADNVEGLVRLLETNFGVRAERRGGEIVLHRGGATP